MAGPLPPGPGSAPGGEIGAGNRGGKSGREIGAREIGEGAIGRRATCKAGVKRCHERCNDNHHHHHHNHNQNNNNNYKNKPIISRQGLNYGGNSAERLLVDDVMADDYEEPDDGNVTPHPHPHTHTTNARLCPIPTHRLPEAEEPDDGNVTPLQASTLPTHPPP